MSHQYAIRKVASRHWIVLRNGEQYPSLRWWFPTRREAKEHLEWFQATDRVTT